MTEQAISHGRQPDTLPCVLELEGDLQALITPDYLFGAFGVGFALVPRNNRQGFLAHPLPIIRHPSSVM